MSNTTSDTAPDSPVHYATLASLQALVGQALGSSPWVTVDQRRIDLFAEATGDHQWIHLDATFGWQNSINGAKIFVMHFSLRGEAVVRIRELRKIAQAAHV